MNIENVNRAADAYLAEAEGATAARLEFLKGLWALQAELAGSAPAHTLPDAEAARDALAGGHPIFSVVAPNVPADAFRDAVAQVVAYVIRTEVLEAGEAQTLSASDVPAAVADDAVGSAVADFDGFVSQVAASIRENAAGAVPSLATLAFVLHSALVPFLAEASSGAMAVVADFDWSVWGSGRCPVCGASAALGRMSESTKIQGSSRQLWCSQCHAEWRYERLRCARCGSRNQEKLRYAYDEADPVHRLHLCEQCHGYLKVTFEDATDKPVSMVVEEAASINLDAIARAEGYTATGSQA